MHRYLETFYRHRWLLLLPVVVATAVGGAAAYVQPSSYEASANIWIDPPIDSSSSTANNPYLTAADRESAVLQELMTSPSFCEAVAKAANLDDYLRSHAGGGGLTSMLGRLPGLGAAFSAPAQQADPAAALRDQEFQLVSSRTTVVAAGPQMVSITFSSPDKLLAAPTVQAIVDQFSATVLADRVTQLKAAVDFYQPQVNRAEADLAAADANVGAYLDAHPALKVPGAIPDATLASLNRTDDLLRQRYTGAAQQLQEAQLSLAAASQPGAAGFKEIDKPVEPLRATGTTKRLAMGAGGGFAAGVLISLVALVLLTLGGGVVRLPEDVAALTGSAPVAAVPTIARMEARVALSTQAGRRRRWPLRRAG